jgi:hypothetical protein
LKAEVPFAANNKNSISLARQSIRKGLEAYFTVFFDQFIWGKERIMEVYLNSMKWGGVWRRSCKPTLFLGFIY